jgi:HPt (histidine-containing phosphotransfer) domain-containing protein
MTDGHDGAAVLDMDVLNELRAATGDDEEFLRDLVSTYVEETATHLDALDAAAKAGDADGLVRPAHTLKSTSATIGAMRLSGICRDIEAAGRDGRSDDSADAVALARATWRDTLRALRSSGLTA